MGDQVNAQQEPVPPDYGGGIRPPGDTPPPITPFPVEEVLSSLSPLGLSPEQTSGVLNCMKETGLRWVIPRLEATIERTAEVMEQVVKSYIQEVAAGAINSFGSFAVLCVQELMRQQEQLKMQHQKELAQWKDYATHLMLNLNHEIGRKEAEKRKLEEDLEFARRISLSSPETHTQKRGSSKRKGDELVELEQRQTAKTTPPSRGSFGTSCKHPRQKLNSVITGLPVMASQTLMEHLATCVPPASMKVPPLEVSPPDMDKNGMNHQHVLNRLPSFVTVQDKAPEEESAREVGQFESRPCSAPFENPKGSKGTSGEGSVLTSSHLLEDSQSGADDVDDGNIQQSSPDSEKASDEQEEPSEKLRKTTSDGLDSSFSTSKQASEEGDNLQSVLADDVDKADTTAALSLCQLGEFLVPQESVKYFNGGSLEINGLDEVPSKNHIGCNFLQDSFHEPDAKKKKKSTVLAKTDFMGSTSCLDEVAKRTPTRRKPSFPTSGNDQRPLTQGSPTASEVEAYASRDHRRVSVVAKQLMAMSERKYG